MLLMVKYAFTLDMGLNLNKVWRRVAQSRNFYVNLSTGLLGRFVIKVGRFRKIMKICDLKVPNIGRSNRKLSIFS